MPLQVREDKTLLGSQAPSLLQNYCLGEKGYSLGAGLSSASSPLLLSMPEGPDGTPPNELRSQHPRLQKPAPATSWALSKVYFEKGKCSSQ